jgi:zeaxanthin glucosyltransferase
MWKNAMSRIGFFTLPYRGHLNPAMALGRKLSERGHEVIFFNSVLTRAVLRTAGLSFYPLSIGESHNLVFRKFIGSNLSIKLQRQQLFTQSILREAPEAIKSAGIEALVIDQMDYPVGTVADRLNIPYVSLGLVPPIYLSAFIPLIWYPWRYHDNMVAQIRNRFGNTLFRFFFAPVLAAINRQRRIWRLPVLRNINGLFSNLAIITQVPKDFDFPCHGFPPQLYHTGPFIDGTARRVIHFPWERLNGKPLIYASMGTRKNEDLHVFRIIAEACTDMEAQLVMSLGGNLEEVGPLAGNPIVVPYAPQLEILSQASIAITHAGINTTLESLANGIPLAAIPISDDQPSVAARIERIGAGKAVSYKNLSVKRLRHIIQQVMENPQYKYAAQHMKTIIQSLHGLERAADIIEETLKRPGVKCRELIS